MVETVIESWEEEIAIMDETHVKTSNFPNRMVVEKGIEIVRKLFKW